MLKNQQEIAQSKDLKFAMNQISEISEIGNHITHTLTNADLIQLGGIAAVEYCGGPSMMLRMGRLYGTHWHLSKRDANGIVKAVDMDVSGQAGDEAGWAA